MSSNEIYVSTDVEADGPIPGPNSMLSFGSAAYTGSKELIGTFSILQNNAPCSMASSRATWVWAYSSNQCLGIPPAAWLSPSTQQAAQTTLPDPRLKQRRLGNIALAYEIMMIGTASIVPYCTFLDRSLYASPTSATGNFAIKHVGDRIAFGRHATGHGHLGDISSEAVFYGLMTAMVFYSQ
jgi:hypothetical protein